MAWEFVAFLAEKETMKKMYSAQAQTRTFGEIYSRTDLAQELAQDPYVAAYLTDAPNAKSWYMSSYTHDNGLNDQIIKYYEDAINAVLGGKDPEDVLMTVDQGVRQVMRQYNVP